MDSPGKLVEVFTQGQAGSILGNPDRDAIGLHEFVESYFMFDCGANYQEAHELANIAEQVLRDMKHRCTLQKTFLKTIGGYDFYKVNGCALRDQVHIDFCLGGNAARYTFIPGKPRREIWVE